MFPTHDLHHFALIATFLCFYLQCASMMGKHGHLVGRSGDIIFLHPENLPSGSVASVKWKYDDLVVCKHNRGNTTCHTTYHVFPNGTLRLNASKSRGGTYRLEMHDNNGILIEESAVTLGILEPVSGTEVQQACTVDGRVLLTCSVTQGENVTFRWTLNTTSENETFSKKQTVYFFYNIPENLICEVENAVSTQNSAPVTLICRGYMSTLITLGVFLVISLSCTAIWSIRRKPPKATEDVEENVYVSMRGGRETKKDTVADDVSQYVAWKPQPLKANDSEKTEDAEEVYM